MAAAFREVALTDVEIGNAPAIRVATSVLDFAA
jgi:hypothetical protein